MLNLPSTQALAKPQRKQRQSQSIALFRAVNQAFVLQPRDRDISDRIFSLVVMLSCLRFTKTTIFHEHSSISVQIFF